MTRRAGVFRAAAALVLLAGPALRAVAQDDDPQHPADPAALRAFRQMVEAYRKRPALHVTTKVTVELVQGEQRSRQPEVQAEFDLAPGKAGVIRLRGFTCWVGGGKVSAVHESTEHSYFSMPDDGAPYYALMSIFQQMPFPDLALAFGDDDVEALCMEFHQMAPWVRPTGVAEVVSDGKPLQQIRLTSDFEDMTVLVDPESRLIESLELDVTGGDLVREGTTLRYVHRFEYEIPEAPFGPDLLGFDPGERQRVDTLASLVARPRVEEAVEAPEEQGGGLAGRPAPDFVLSTADGGAVDLEMLRGQVVVLDFWATWCGPCRVALPLLHQVDRWAKERGLPVKVLTVNVLEIQDPQANTPEARLEKVREFWRKQGFTLPVAMDFTDETAAAYGVRGIPTTVVIRPDGTVHAVHVGAPPHYVESLRAEIDEALGGAAADDGA